MTNKLSLKKNFSLVLLGNAIYAFTQWLLVIMFSKLGSVTLVGDFSLGMAIVSPIFLFSSLQMRSLQSTDTNYKLSFHEYLSTRLFLSLCAYVIVFVYSLVYTSEAYLMTIILIIAFGKVIESISDVIYADYQRREYMRVISASLILKGIVSSIIVLLSLLWQKNNVIVITSLVISWIIVFVCYDLRKALSLGPIRITLPRRGVLIELLKKGIPLGFVSLIISLNDSIPKLIIERQLGTEELGYFSSIVYITFAGGTVINALGQSAAPRLANHYINNIINFKRMVNKLALTGLLIGLLLIAIAYIFGDYILSIAYTSDYLKYKKLFVLVMLWASIGYVSSFYGYAMTAARKINVQPKIFIMVLIVIALLSLVLIQDYGLYGVVYAMIAGAIVQLISSYLVILKIK